MEVDVEDLAVTAPVASEAEKDALVLGAGPVQRGGDVGLGIGDVGVEVRIRAGEDTG